jgi:predicted transcriptional regulator
MDKTIKEFADELGVTRQAIQYHVTNNFGNKLAKNKKGISVLNLEQQRTIMKLLTKNSDKVLSVSSKQKTDELSVSQYKQIKNLREQNNDLRKLLDQQQQLQLRTQKQLEDKTLLLETNKEDMRLTSDKYEDQLTKIENLYLQQAETEREKTRIFFYLTIILSVVIVVILGLWWFL